jgi:hypothetical protein
MRDVTLWLAEHVFGATPPLVYTGNSGDTVFHWVQTAWLLIVAIAVTAIWSAADRRRTEYVTLHAWLRLFVRFALVSQMFYYGMAKVVPPQFPPPSLVTLLQPIGSMSPSDLLWRGCHRPGPTSASAPATRPDAPGEGLQVAHRGAALAAHHADRPARRRLLRPRSARHRVHGAWCFA